MEFWSILILILKNLKYVVEFVKIIDQAVKDGVNEADLKKSIANINKGFEDAKTKEESAQRANRINRAFRRLSKQQN